MGENDQHRNQPPTTIFSALESDHTHRIYAHLGYPQATDLLSILASSSPSSPQFSTVSLLASMFFRPTGHPHDCHHFVGQVCPSECSVRHYDPEILERIPQATCIKGQAASDSLFLTSPFHLAVVPQFHILLLFLCVTLSFLPHDTDPRPQYLRSRSRDAKDDLVSSSLNLKT
ncbi:hypothetical protein BJ165DRAFT_1529831 [Panaeolus papilionaceus]|nr:hypothetical protein BJ165DRAFT_1529831 [Panaeolus papilionaceus]